MVNMDTTYCTGHLNDGRRFFAELTTAHLNGYADCPFDVTIDNLTGSIEVISVTHSDIKDVEPSTPSGERDLVRRAASCGQCWTCSPSR